MYIYVCFTSKGEYLILDYFFLHASLYVISIFIILFVAIIFIRTRIYLLCDRSTITCISDTKIPHVSPRNHRATSPPSLPHLFIFALIYFYFICRRKSRLSPAVPLQPRRDATSTVNRKPCGIVAILSRMRVSTCTRRSYARRSKYGNAFTRNVFTGISRNTKSAREASLTVYKQA